MDDAREYLETRNAMDIVGISQDEQVTSAAATYTLRLFYNLIYRLLLEQEAIFRVVAAILHLGNIEFVKGSEVDSSKLKNDKAWYHLQTVAELLL